MTYNYYKLIFIFALMGLIFNASAQTKLSGTIVNKSDEPQSGVWIDFGNGLIQTTSDINGNFSFTYSDTLKNRTIRFHLFGFKDKAMIVNKGQETLRVILLDSLYILKGVTVSAPKYGRFADYSAQTVKMSSFDVVTNPAAMADIIGSMRVLPGVQTNDNDGRLIVQGGSPTESQFYINDLIVANPYNLSSNNSGVRSRFSPDLFNGVVLQSGGSNAEFGQAMSGIINLNTKEKKDMEPKTDLSLSSVFASATHIDQKPSYAYRASLSYMNLEPYEKLFPDGYDWNKYYEQIAADFFLTKEFSLKTKMTAQANFSSSAVDYSYENVDSIRFDNNMKETYFYAQANLYHAFNRKWNLSIASNVIVDIFSGTEVQVKNDRVEDLNIWNHSKINLQYASGKLTNRTGVEYLNNPFKETYTLGQDYKMNVDNDLVSLYNDTKLFLTNNLTVSLGLRGEYSTYLKEFNWAPRFYLGYRLNRENIISASLGEYFQLPTMDYLKFSRTIDFTSATRGTLSYSYVEKNSKFQLDTYYKKYHNAITYSQKSLSQSDIQNEGKGYGWGADLFWKSNFKPVEYWLTYSYNHTEKKYAYYANEIAPPYIAPHSFNLVLKYWIAPLKSLLGSSYNVSSGTPYYSNVRPYDELGTTPFHNRLDVSWSYLPKTGIVIHFGCQNLLGYKNIYGYNYSQINPGVRQEITNPNKRFFFLGVFITLSKNKKLNQLKTL